MISSESLARVLVGTFSLPLTSLNVAENQTHVRTTIYEYETLNYNM